MSTLPSFESPNAANQPAVENLEPPVEPGRFRELTAGVVDRLRYVGHLISNSTNPDPNYTSPDFERFRQNRANKQR